MSTSQPLLPGDRVEQQLPPVTLRFFDLGAPAFRRSEQILPERRARLLVTRATKPGATS